MKKPNPWLMYVVLYFGALSISINQFKIAPILTVVANDLNVSLTAASWLTSIFLLAGVVLAIPSAFILKALGPKRLGVTILSLLTAGSLLGAFSNSFVVMLISRIIEGIGFAFIITLGIVLISSWFEPKKIGLMIGIFTTFPALASAIMLGYGAQISEALGNWKALWYIGAGLAAVATILFAIVVKVDPVEAQEEETPKLSMREGLKNRKALILGLAQGAVAFILFAYLNNYFTIFNSFYGFSIPKSGMYCSIAGYLGIASCILSGILISKTGKPSEIALISFILLIFVSLFTFKLNEASISLHVIVMSITTGLIIPAVLAIGPSTATNPMYIGFAIAMINEIYYIGALIGPPILTSAMERDPVTAAVPLVIVSVLGVAAMSAYMCIIKKEKELA